jgi:REP element-mobilizing transposase RayT
MPQSLVQNYVHIVFATKGRKNLINGHMNHIHILCQLSRTIPISKLIEQLKSASSKWIKAENNLENFAWQNGYSAFSVQYNNVVTVVDYIANQDAHHQKLSFEDELRKLELKMPWSLMNAIYGIEQCKKGTRFSRAINLMHQDLNVRWCQPFRPLHRVCIVPRGDGLKQALPWAKRMSALWA